MSRTPALPADDEGLARLAAQRDASAHALAGGRAAFAELYERHQRGLVAFLRTRVRPPDDAEDVAADTWRRAWERLPTQYTGRNFRGWLFAIAHNRAVDVRRRPHAVAAPDVLAAVPDGRDDAEPAYVLLAEERRLAVTYCLDKLQRADPEGALVLRARLGGEKYPELCTRLSVPRERAYKLFHAAAKQLEDCVRRTLS